MWAISVLAGGGLFLTAGTSAAVSLGLVPQTFVRQVVSAVGPQARDIRFTTAFGSGHAGSWQFEARVTYLDRTGLLRGGQVHAPPIGSRMFSADPPGTPGLSRDRGVGWTTAELDRVLRRDTGIDDPLALVQLDLIVVDHGLFTCHGTAAAAGCQQHDRTGRLLAMFGDHLTDAPLAGPLAVSRTGATLD